MNGLGIGTGRTGTQRACLLFVGLTLLAGSGCSVRKMALKETGELIGDGMVAITREPDYLFARDALPANLQMLEVLLTSDPDNRDLLFSLVQGYAAYAFLVVEDDLDLADAAGEMEQVRLHKDRAAAFYQRAAVHALRWLDSKDLRQALAGEDVGKLRQAVAKLGKEEQPVLFWLTFAVAGQINLDQSNPARVAELPKAEVLLQRALALDASYYHGLPELFAGVFYGGRPPMFGGDLVRGRQHFDRGIAISEGRFLLGRFLLARYIAVQAQDRPLFCSSLAAVIDAPADPLPDQRLMNEVSRRWARRWRDRAPMLFESGGEGGCTPPQPAEPTKTEEDDGLLLQ